MLKEERLQKILAHLALRPSAQLSELSALLGVSEDTVRRDIRTLSDRGQLRAVRGGAVAHSPIARHYREREHQDLPQKERIADKAITLLQPGQLVFLDGGTTTLAVARRIPKDLSLTIVTNSFPVADALEDHPSVELLFAGGRLNKPAFATTGHQTLDFLRGFRPDLCFLGVCSIHPELGMTAMDYEDAALKKTMVDAAQRTVALLTLDKTNTAESYVVCPATRLWMLITESDPQEEALQAYRSMGVALW